MITNSKISLSKDLYLGWHSAFSLRGSIGGPMLSLDNTALYETLFNHSFMPFMGMHCINIGSSMFNMFMQSNNPNLLTAYLFGIADFYHTLRRWYGISDLTFEEFVLYTSKICGNKK